MGEGTYGGPIEGPSYVMSVPSRTGRHTPILEQLFKHPEPRSQVASFVVWVGTGVDSEQGGGREEGELERVVVGWGGVRREE